MKKSGVFLFVMSIILLLRAVFEAVGLINWLYKYNINIADPFLRPYLIYFLIYFSIGLFGIIGSIKRGRLTVVCIVFGSLLSLYVLGEGVVYILRGFFVSFVSYGFSFVCFALYTAAAVIAFKFRKTASNF